MTMYLGVDVGGTKTLVASLTDKGAITESVKFPTPKNYNDFLPILVSHVQEFKHQDFKAIGIGAPGRIDRKSGVLLRCANLPWKNEHIKTDLVRRFHTPTILENDAKLATLSEALLLKDAYKRVLYVTISTGIGAGVAQNGKLDPSYLDMESGQAIFEHHGTLKRWEEFASGKAIVRQFGKQASEINDSKTWRTIVRYWSPGFSNMIANVQPEVIVIGGSVGAHFNKYKDILRNELKKYETPLTPLPVLLGAQRPEEAVVYGCYDLAKERYGNIT
jgi:predicted NBD/HSP70 family sugar kinase